MKKYILIFTILSTISLVGCGHEHTFSDATCESPRICLECQETEGEKLSHNWLEATCESPKICSLCNITEGEPLEHQWLEATIESPMTCSLCGLTEGEPIEAPIQTNEDGATVITLDPETDYIEPTETEDTTSEAKTNSDLLSNVERIRKDTEDQYKKGIIDKDMYDFMMEQLAIQESDIIASESKPSTPSPSSSGTSHYTEETYRMLEEMQDGTQTNEDLKGVQPLGSNPDLAGYNVR